MAPAAAPAAVAAANPPRYAPRRPLSSERTAPRSPAASRFARISVSRPGAGAEELRLGHRLGVDLGPAVGEHSVVDELLVAVPGALGEERGGAVGGDPVHPRRELSVAAEPLQSPISPEIGLLHHVARILLV